MEFILRYTNLIIAIIILAFLVFLIIDLIKNIKIKKEIKKIIKKIEDKQRLIDYFMKNKNNELTNFEKIKAQKEIIESLKD